MQTEFEIRDVTTRDLAKSPTTVTILPSKLESSSEAFMVDTSTTMINLTGPFGQALDPEPTILDLVDNLQHQPAKKFKVDADIFRGVIQSPDKSARSKSITTCSLIRKSPLPKHKHRMFSKITRRNTNTRLSYSTEDLALPTVFDSLPSIDSVVTPDLLPERPSPSKSLDNIENMQILSTEDTISDSLYSYIPSAIVQRAKIKAESELAQSSQPVLTSEFEASSSKTQKTSPISAKYAKNQAAVASAESISAKTSKSFSSEAKKSAIIRRKTIKRSNSDRPKLLAEKSVVQPSSATDSFNLSVNNSFNPAILTGDDNSDLYENVKGLGVTDLQKTVCNSLVTTPVSQTKGSEVGPIYDVPQKKPEITKLYQRSVKATEKPPQVTRRSNTSMASRGLPPTPTELDEVSKQTDQPSSQLESKPKSIKRIITKKKVRKKVLKKTDTAIPKNPTTEDAPPPMIRSRASSMASNVGVPTIVKQAVAKKTSKDKRMSPAKKISKVISIRKSGSSGSPNKIQVKKVIKKKSNTSLSKLKQRLSVSKDQDNQSVQSSEVSTVISTSQPGQSTKSSAPTGSTEPRIILPSDLARPAPEKPVKRSLSKNHIQKGLDQLNLKNRTDSSASTDRTVFNFRTGSGQATLQDPNHPYHA